MVASEVAVRDRVGADDDAVGVGQRGLALRLRLRPGDDDGLRVGRGDVGDLLRAAGAEGAVDQQVGVAARVEVRLDQRRVERRAVGEGDAVLQRQGELKDGVTFTDGSTLDSALVKANLDARSDTDLLTYGSSAPAGRRRSPTSPRPTRRPSSSPGRRRRRRARTTSPTAGIIVGKDGVANPDSLETTPDGSGPYTLNTGKTTKGSTYTFDKNAKAWNAGDWSYDHIVFKVITDPQALANAVVSGQADVAMLLDRTTVDLVESKQTTQGRRHHRRLPGRSTSSVRPTRRSRTPTSGWL